MVLLYEVDVGFPGSSSLFLQLLTGLFGGVGCRSCSASRRLSFSPILILVSPLTRPLILVTLFLTAVERDDWGGQAEDTLAHVQLSVWYAMQSPAGYLISSTISPFLFNCMRAKTGTGLALLQGWILVVGRTLVCSIWGKSIALPCQHLFSRILRFCYGTEHVNCLCGIPYWE